MPVIVKSGNLFDAFHGEKVVLVHGCNAQHVMGSGVAKLVRLLYPTAYHEYIGTPTLKLGSVVYVCINDTMQLWIANAITQTFYGRDGKAYADVDAIRKSMLDVAARFPDYKIIMPAIGCGLGGLTKDVVYPIIKDCFVDHDCTIYEL